MVHNDNFTIETLGECDVHNITPKVEKIVKNSQIQNGHVLIFVTGSTVSVSTMEVEAELDKDLNEALKIIAPIDKDYHHNKKWGDGNGYSHVRSTIIGTSQVVPLINGELVLGNWQQLVLMDFDNKKRDRLVTVQIVGE